MRGSFLLPLPFYFDVARADFDFAEVIPETVSRALGEVAVYLGHPNDSRPLGDHASPSPGSLVVLQRRGGAEPETLGAQRVLNGLPHLEAGDPIPVASPPEPEQVLILGVLFDQRLSQLAAGADDATVVQV